MSLKEKVQAMKSVTTVKASRHGYTPKQVYSVLYAYIAELEGKLAEATKPEPKKAPAKKAPVKKKAPAKKK